MLDIFLLVSFTIFILVSGIKILRKNILFGGVYFFLYIYSIFAQIGYCFFPELSEFINAYFGKETFYIFFFFNFLSFLSFYLIFYFLFPYLKKFKKYEIVRTNNANIYLVYLLILILYGGFLLIYSIKNSSIINYGNASDEVFIQSQGIGYIIFTTCFKLLAPLNIILYSQFRIKSIFKRISALKRGLLTIVSLFFIVLLIYLATKLGSRTDILALLLGITVLEIKLGFSLKKFLTFLFIGFVALFFLITLERSRVNENIESKLLYEQVLVKDYFAPAHMLYTAIGYSYVDPILVVKSNIGNTLIKMNQPYLQMPLTELINPGVATRSAGYAFYYFTEGFLFMGFLGFLYNGISIFFNLSIWYLIQNSKNKYYGYILLSIMCTQFANIVRSQGSYFYKDIYLMFLPCVILIFLSSQLFPKFLIKNKISPV